MRSFGGYRSAVEHLKFQDPILFGKLNESTVRGWFQPGSYRDISPRTLEALKRGKSFYKPLTSGSKHILDSYPNITQELLDTLSGMRDTGTALNLISVQAIMRAVLKQRHPHILYENGGKLKLSKWFCKRFVKKHLNWCVRRATTAAQKLPSNWQKLVDDMIKRLAIVVYEGRIPQELMFSMDETFCFFVPMGHATTLAQRGSKVMILLLPCPHTPNTAL